MIVLVVGQAIAAPRHGLKRTRPAARKRVKKPTQRVQKPTPVEFLTDLEGNWQRLESFVKKSQALYFTPSGELAIKPGQHFVFGGDAVDHGPHALRILEALVSLKKRYPNQVTLLAGNRDINKVRLRAELSDQAMRSLPKGKMGPRYLEWLQSEVGLNRSLRRAELRRHDTKSNRLKFILAKTMGAGQAFENRRTELAASGRYALPISDAQVTRSFLRDLKPGGLHYEYLQVSEVAKVIDGNLFVHGAVNDGSIGHVPGKRGRFRNPHHWVKALNAWKEDEWNAWKAGKGCDALIAYQQPDPKTPKKNDRSTIYGRFGDTLNNVRLPGRKTIDLLTAYGIYRVISGHTPSGDSAAIAKRRGFEIVTADNSRSRGDDGTYLRLLGRELLTESILPSGSKLTAKTHVDRLGRIGRLTRGGKLVRGTLDNGNYQLARWARGFREELTEVTPAQLDAMGLRTPRRR